MKLIHTGDIHIGSAMKNLPFEKAQLRKREILDGFRELVFYAKAQGVDAVLIAGDLFDENGVERQVLNEVLSIIETAQPICFFYVSGNHDDEFFVREGMPKNLYTFSQKHTWQAYRLNENVVINGADTRNFSARLFDDLRINTSDFNIVLLHGDISTSAEKESIPLARMQGKGVDYFALGHIHKPMRTTNRLDDRALFRYCGCLVGRGFDECGERGFFLLEIDKGRLVNEKFISVAKRNIWEACVDISNCKGYYEVENTVFTALQAHRKEDMLKILLVGNRRVELTLNIPLLTQRVSERFFHVRVEDKTRLFINRESLLKDFSELGEFAREVGRYEMNEDFRAEVLEVGLKAILGEDIDL